MREFENSSAVFLSSSCHAYLHMDFLGFDAYGDVSHV